MLTIICVLRSGGIYDQEWVRKLHDGVKRNLSIPHNFRCISDVDVPCNRIHLDVDWPSWWAKIFMFKPGVIVGPTLYLDLDTVVTGSIDKIRTVPVDFAMLRNFWKDDMVGSGVMWFSGENVPHKVYEKFVRQPKAYIAHHQRNADGPYLGDQAFTWDCLNREVAYINDHFDGIRSYKMHCRKGLPSGTSLVCFHGTPRITDVDAPWVKENWA